DGRDTTASLLLAVLTHYLPVHGYCSSSLIPSPHSQPLLPLILLPLSRDSTSRAPPADSPGSSHLPRIRCIHGISTSPAPPTTKPLLQPSSSPPAIADLAAAIAAVCSSSALPAAILAVALHPCQNIKLQAADSGVALPARHDSVVYEFVAAEKA
ncbi:unnamed protein product, partial [Urochloa humidicola]